MKLDRKLLLVLLPLLLISTTTIVYAYNVYGNVRDVNIIYTIFLGVPTVVGSTVSLTATLTINGVPIPSATVAFFHCTAAGLVTGANTTALGTGTTNALGIATFSQLEMTNGLYHYTPLYTF